VLSTARADLADSAEVHSAEEPLLP